MLCGPGTGSAAPLEQHLAGRVVGEGAVDQHAGADAELAGRRLAEGDGHRVRVAGDEARPRPGRRRRPPRPARARRIRALASR